MSLHERFYGELDVVHALRVESSGANEVTPLIWALDTHHSLELFGTQHTIAAGLVKCLVEAAEGLLKRPVPLFREASLRRSGPDRAVQHAVHGGCHVIDLLNLLAQSAAKSGQLFWVCSVHGHDGLLNLTVPTAQCREHRQT